MCYFILFDWCTKGPIILVVIVMRGLDEFIKVRVVNNDIFLNDINQQPSFPLRDALRGVMQRVKRTSATHPSVTLVAFREILESHYDVCASFMLATFQASSCARKCDNNNDVSISSFFPKFGVSWREVA